MIINIDNEIEKKETNRKERDKPKGVVSKNDVGDRSTAFKAALKRFKLANNDMTLNVDISFLFIYFIITRRRTYANVKLNEKEKMA